MTESTGAGHADFEDGVAVGPPDGRAGAFYDLTLYVSGASDLAARAIANARRLCDVHLNGRHHLTVVDIHVDPTVVLSRRLLATPTLVKNEPQPVRRVVGDLSHTDKVLRALELPVPADAHRHPTPSA